MNCKPGDLAMYVGKHSEFHGSVVRVVREIKLSEDQEPFRMDRLYWLIEPALGGNYKCADCSLRPIRNPGDDARDETLDWLPVPTTSKPAYAANFAAYIAEGELPLGRIWASRSQ